MTTKLAALLEAGRRKSVGWSDSDDLVRDYDRLAVRWAKIQFMEDIRQQAAEEALRPIRECGVTAEDLDGFALLLEDEGFPGAGKELTTLTAALRKALDGPERPSDSPG